MGARLMEVRHVSRAFRGLTAVDDYSLTLDAGELVGLIGPNGAGKTTTFNMISGVIKPSQGEVLLKGEPITHLPPDQIVRRGIARTFQNIRLFGPLTVLDNVLAGIHLRHPVQLGQVVLNTRSYRARLQESEDRARELLTFFGLDEYRSQQASALPYGHQRKLEIARAMATEPAILLLDEPAAGMNPTEAAELTGMIGKIRERFHMAILLVEHHMQVVMNLCDRLQVLNYGKLIAEGPTAEVRQNPTVIEAYLGVQSHA